ncbi:MAG: TolC family protein [Bacteroidetes bacterium]|nr:TolC family protein [Bacteroidota bacterium]
MAKRTLALSLLLLVMGMMGLQAAPHILTLDEAIDIALQKNKNVQIARYGIDKADAQVSEALGNALPSLNLSAQYTRNIQLPVIFFPNPSDPAAGVVPFRIGLDNQYSAGLGLTQILFNSAVFTGIGASQIYYRAAQQRYNSVVATTIAETKKSFYRAMLAQAYDTISVSTLRNGENNLKNIKALFDEGLVAEYDYIRAQVLVDNIKPTVTESHAQFNNALNALQTQIGADALDSIGVSGSFIEAIQAIPDESEALSLAFKNNFELKAAQLAVEVQDEFTKVYRSDYYPTLSAFGNYNNIGQSDSFKNFLSATTSNVGLSLSWNIFNGLKTNAKVEQSKADYESARTQYAQLKDYVKLQMLTVMNNLRSAVQRIEAQTSTVQQASRGYDIALIRYREGTGNLLEINDAELAFARAKVNRVQSIHDYYAARADYEKLIAGFDPKYFLQVK